MRRMAILKGLAALCLCAQLSAEIHLQEVMSKEQAKETGVNTLTRAQRRALEKWLDQTFVLKTATKKEELYVSENLSGGRFLKLSDGSYWAVDPADLPLSSGWLTPFPMRIEPSNHPDYPCLLINTYSGDSVKAKRIKN